jgi:Cu(I)/Ag(I) efflux system membrane fusion protein
LNRTFPGKVARFSVDVRSDTRTMHTEVDVPNPGRVLMPGLYAEAEVGLDQKDDVASVPVQAISHHGDKATVFVVNHGGEVEERTVQMGLQTATDAEILSGLNEGEQVVVSDSSGLKPGQKVHPQAMAVMQYQEQNAP